jgi:hypothetical protein
MPLVLSPRDDDAVLLTLELQFGSLVGELQAVEGASNQLRNRRPRVQAGSKGAIQADHDAQIPWTEAILARLYPIEQAIMQTPACTIVGLGVKARHAAYVISQYWEEPLEQIDWEAQAVRLLIEAVCGVARTPLPFRAQGSDK